VPADSETRVPIVHEGDIVSARQKGRELAVQAGFSASELTLIATAISEVARNIVVYATSGEISLGLREQQGRRGIEIVASDQGPGIPNIALAMQDGYSTKRSLGLGLPGSRRIMDDFHITSEVGRGTVITMIKWAR